MMRDLQLHRYICLCFFVLGSCCFDGHAVVLPRGQQQQQGRRGAWQSTTATAIAATARRSAQKWFTNSRTNGSVLHAAMEDTDCSLSSSEANSSLTTKSTTTQLSASSQKEDDNEADDTLSSTTATLSTTTESDTVESSSNRTVLLTGAVSALGLLTLLAKFGVLPGPLLLSAFSSSTNTEFVPYTNSMIRQDVGVTIITAILGTALVKLVTTATDREWLEPRDARKIIHTLSAPLFMLFWPLFSSATGAQWFAATVPALNAWKLYRAATASDEMSLRRAVSRSGDAAEALGGPFIYVVLLATGIVTNWRT